MTEYFVLYTHRLFRQVLNEVLRLTTLATFSARCSDDDIVVGGYLIPAGTPIVMALGVSLKNETVWKNTEKLVKNVTRSVRICYMNYANLTIGNISMSSIHLLSLKNSK